MERDAHDGRGCNFLVWPFNLGVEDHVSLAQWLISAGCGASFSCMTQRPQTRTLERPGDANTTNIARENPQRENSVEFRAREGKQKREIEGSHVGPPHARSLHTGQLPLDGVVCSLLLMCFVCCLVYCEHWKIG